MTVTKKMLCVAYGAIGLLALVSTWSNNIQYVGLGFLGANVHFWEETFANPASRSITVDLLFLTAAASVWMVLEARRLAMRAVWLYVLFGVVIASSVTFPVFLINRERALANAAPTLAGTLRPWDALGLAVLILVAVMYGVATIMH